MAALAQNEMKAKDGMPEQVGSNEGLGVIVEVLRNPSANPLRRG